jgi:filamentous hemagglutinin
LGIVLFNGAAANAERMADRVAIATGGTGQVLQSTHMNDSVGTLLGGNSQTGGNSINFFDAHGAYIASLPPELNAEGKPNIERKLTDQAWGEGNISTPVLVLPLNEMGRQ